MNMLTIASLALINATANVILGYCMREWLRTTSWRLAMSRGLTIGRWRRMGDWPNVRVRIGVSQGLSIC